MKRLIFLTILVSGMGCGHSAPHPVLKPNNSPEKAALAEKLKALPPDQRQQYMKDHPDEVRKALMNGLMASPHPGAAGGTH